MPLLLDGITADTVGSTEILGDGSDVAVAIEAVSFGGGAVRLEVLRPGGSTWVPVRAASDLSPAPIFEASANTAFNLNLPVGYRLRARLVGSSGANGVTVAVDN